MGQKNRQQQPAAPQRVTVGRSQKVPPAPSPRARLAGQVDRDEKRAKENRDLRAQNAEQAAQIERFKFDQNIEGIALLNIKEAKMSPLDAERLGNTLNARVTAHVARGLPLSKFDPYAVISKFRARLGKAVSPAPQTARAVERNLPPPSQEGRLNPNDASQVLARQEEARERGHRVRERELQDRQKVDAALRKYGLTRGDLPFPGNGGLGY